MKGLQKFLEVKDMMQRQRNNWRKSVKLYSLNKIERN